MPTDSIADDLIKAAGDLRDSVARLKFKSPVTHVYNPLDYAWAAHEMYLRKFGNSSKRVVFLGMNPGPFGMAQTGVPFGEIAAVCDWLKIKTEIGKPEHEHPKRPVEGFNCERAEVSGRRLWGLFAKKFGGPEQFFREHFVANYCPLVFMEASGANVTPNKLRADESKKLYEICDEHLRRVIGALRAEWLIGVGDFAEKRAKLVFANTALKIGKILHPSPASPAANRGWTELAAAQLQSLGI